MKLTVPLDENEPRRTWRGRALFPHEEMLMFHAQAGEVIETLNDLSAELIQHRIDYVVIGAFALGAHNYKRSTNDVDICLRPIDLEKFKNEIVGDRYRPIEGHPRRFLDSKTQVSFDLLVSGALAGRTARNKEIRFPDPAEAQEIAGLRTIQLPRLIELKLVTWRFKDWGDVVELIRANKLNESFADKLNPLVRMAYLECYDQMIEEDKYSPERDDPPT